MVDKKGGLFRRFNDELNLFNELMKINYFIRCKTTRGCSRIASVESSLKNHEPQLFRMYRFVSEMKGDRFDLARGYMLAGLEYRGQFYARTR